MSDLRTSLERVGERIAPRPDAFARLDRRRRRRQRNQRIAAGVVAALVAVAGSVALYAGFRGGPEQPRASLGEVVALWPERSLADAQLAQDKVDAGDADMQWRLDPKATAERFAEDVLGWHPDVTELVEPDTEAPVHVDLRRMAAPCPTPPPGEPVSPTCLPREATLTLDRLVTPGQDGIWSVTGSSSPVIDLPLASGDTVGADQSIRVRVKLKEGLQAVAGAAFFGPDCHDNFSSEHITESGPLVIEIPSGPCAVQGGYVFVYTVAPGSPAYDEDPADGVNLYAPDPFGQRVQPIDLAAVPISVAGAEQASPTGSPATTREWSTHTDDLGWSIDYPGAWFALPFNEFNGRYTTMGAAFSNVELPPSKEGQGQPWPDLSQLGMDGVVLVVSHREGGPAPDLTRDDSSFPLSWDDFQAIPGGLVLGLTQTFRGNGLEFTMLVGGRADATERHLDELRRMVASLRFAEPQTGTELNGYVVMEKADAYPVGSGTVVADVHSGVQPFMLIHAPGGFYALEIDPQLCSDPATAAWDPSVQQVSCKRDGFAWDRSGAPFDTGGPVANAPLPAHPGITAWDGHVMVATGVTYGELPPKFWR